MPPASLPRRVFRTLAYALLSAIVGLAIGGAVLWRTGWFERLELDVEARLIESYVRELQPHLPFRIEKFEVRKDWRRVLGGQIDEVNLVLRFDTGLGRFGSAEGHWRLQMRGPVTIGRASPDLAHPGERHYQVTFAPGANLEQLDARGATRSESPPLKLKLWVKAAQNLRHVDTVGLETGEVSDWSWRPVGVALDHFSTQLSWDIEDGKGRVAAQAKSIHWSAADGKRDVVINRPDLAVDTPFAVSAEKPPLFGPEIAFRFTAGDAEVLWNDAYADLPLRAAPVIGVARVEREGGKPRLKSLDARLGTARAQARIGVELSDRRARVRWRDGGMPLKDAVSELLDATSQIGPVSRALAPLRSLDIRGGKVHADLALEVPLDFAAQPDPARLRGEGKIELKDVSLDDRPAKLAVRGLDLTLPYSGTRGVNGDLEVRALGWRGFRGRLARVPVRLVPRSPGPGWNVEVGADATLPLTIDDVPLRLGRLRGEIGAESDPERAWSLAGSLSLPATPIERLLRLACVKTKRVPPANAMAEFKELELRPGTVEPTGYARVELFDGFAEATEMGAYHLGGAVPELDFDLRFNGIRLDQLGDWIGFGEMDGVFAGFARDVVFQGWLPTQYEVKVEAKPFRRDKIVFSPDAMRNFTRLIVADTIDKLPGVADWLAFGWPSRLFNGYDVNYLGVYLFSYDGTILLETIDPPEIYKRERKHYILYGPRFKMPLVSKSYPVAADATAAANLVHHMTQQVRGLIEKKNGKDSANGQDDQTDDDCVPVL